MRMKNANVFFILGGTNVTMGGGTQNFWDWGTGLQGGDNLWMGGGGPPPYPPYLTTLKHIIRILNLCFIEEKIFLKFFLPRTPV